MMTKIWRRCSLKHSSLVTLCIVGIKPCRVSFGAGLLSALKDSLSSSIAPQLVATYRVCLWSPHINHIQHTMYKPRQQGRIVTIIKQNVLVSEFQHCSRGSSQVEQCKADLGDDCR